MPEERILSLHPDGKKGVHILKRRYDLVADTILQLMREHEGAISFSTLVREGKARLKTKLDGSPAWYLTTVKLDLEARGIIQRLDAPGPQVLQLVEKP